MKRTHARMASAPANADSLICAICLAPVEQLRQPSTIACNHMYSFCRECILALPDLTMFAEIPAGEVVRGAEIRRGALGTVFAGTWGGRPVTLKLIEAAALGAAEERKAATRRLRREAASLSMVRHPGVVQFYGVVWEAGGGATLVTERADTSLRALLAERRLSLAECIDLGEQVLGALAHLHSRNIVHRDVKPSNILVFRGDGGRLQYKLADFGITLAGIASTATAAVGTVAYAAPEALQGEGRPDFAVDVYGAAVVLNEALAGRVPFPGVHPFQLMRRVVDKQRPEVANEGVPSAVRALVERMWAGGAAARPSAEQARRALVAARSPPSDSVSSPAAAAVHPIPAASSSSAANAPAAAQPAELLVAAGASVMDAVRQAAPGQTIRLAPGRYKEAVVLEKEVHIVGPRELKAELEWHKGAALHCKGPTAPSVRGITIRNTAPVPEAAAIRITGGSRAVLEGCDVSSTDSSGIEVRDEGTAPALRANAIHDCGHAGILFHATAKGTAEGNNVFGNALAGIEIMTEADPVVRGNTVHDGKTGGILVDRNGRGTVEVNDVFGNAMAGIEIKTGADPVVRGNKIHDQKCGIFVHDGGKGTVSGNTLERISGPKDAIDVEPDCTGCRLQGNVVR